MLAYPVQINHRAGLTPLEPLTVSSLQIRLRYLPVLAKDGEKRNTLGKNIKITLSLQHSAASTDKIIIPIFLRDFLLSGRVSFTKLC